MVPTFVTHFDHPRIFDELAQQPLQILAVQTCVFERGGNWISSAPSLPSAASESRPSRARRSSWSFGRMLAAEVGSITASGECVNERWSFAVKRKFGLTAAALHDHRRPNSGRMCP